MDTSKYFWDHAYSLIYHTDEIDKLKKNIFHYTNADGLLGILQSQKFWGTEATFLNDYMEIKYGTDLIEEIYCEIKKTFKRDWIMDWIEIIKKDMKFDKNREIYVACFSEKGDQLSQWKGYGDFGSGYSIELISSELTRIKRKHAYVNIIIGRVIYNRKIQKNILMNEIKYYIESIDRFILEGDSVNKVLDDAASVFYFYLRNEILYFKSSEFKEEKEWRAIFENALANDKEESRYKETKFRVKDNKIIPYVELDISPSAKKKEWILPIKRIIVGKKVDINRVKTSINIIYKKYDKNKLPLIEYSKISLQ